ncbi:hypothetical protein GGX14DRAFT_619733 [Mycena pura]|uniref:Secreted protein n=1 Tax=Mycena pura TaxID=153505 RepID=A0AAD6YIQ4_9AGAR|nr:hypothetical protein GGX14DRAFT_619733 [Mycena pura]
MLLPNLNVILSARAFLLPANIAGVDAPDSSSGGLSDQQQCLLDCSIAASKATGCTYYRIKPVSARPPPTPPASQTVPLRIKHATPMQTTSAG